MSDFFKIKEAAAIMAKYLNNKKLQKEFDLKLEKATNTKKVKLIMQEIMDKDIEGEKKKKSNVLAKSSNNHPLLVKMPNSYEKISLEYILTQAPAVEQIFSLGGEASSFETGTGTGRDGEGRGGTGREETGAGTGSGRDGEGRVRGGTGKNLPKIELDGALYLIYGDCQSGKTKVIQCISLSHILFNKVSVIVVLDNSTDGANQLKDRCNDFIKNHKKKYGRERVYG